MSLLLAACSSGAPSRSGPASPCPAASGAVRIKLRPLVAATAGTLNASVPIIERRLKAAGIAGTVCVDGDGLGMSVPSGEAARSLRLARAIGHLHVRPVLATLPFEERLSCNESTMAVVPDDQNEALMCARGFDENSEVVPPSVWNTYKVGPTVLVNTDATDPRAAEAKPLDKGWGVDLMMTTRGTALFQELTGRLACNKDPTKRSMAVAVDGLIISHPVMGETIKCNVGAPNAILHTFGRFAEHEAKDLAIILAHGPLPVGFEVAT